MTVLVDESMYNPMQITSSENMQQGKHRDPDENWHQRLPRATAPSYHTTYDEPKDDV